MPKSKKRQYYWHVPPNCWYASVPNASGGNQNVGPDIVVPLIDAETTISAKPEMDEFVVERIVGQYVAVTDAAIPVDNWLHHRIYLSQADNTSFALRSLNTEDDAESSFLWHHVEGQSNIFNNDKFGTWQSAGSGVPAATPWMTRHGHIDVRVGRRVRQGEALLWHTQIVPAPAADNEVSLQMWLRCLVREGK